MCFQSLFKDILDTTSLWVIQYASVLYIKQEPGHSSLSISQAISFYMYYYARLGEQLQC